MSFQTKAQLRREIVQYKALTQRLAYENARVKRACGQLQNELVNNRAFLAVLVGEQVPEVAS